jgi:V/A-type H+-transporting ATPase subunit F
MKFFCLGDQETVQGFRLAGVEGKVVATAEQGRPELAQALAAEDVGVIIVPGWLAGELEPEINAARFSRTRPAIVEIPGPAGPRPARPELLDLIRLAIGVRV